MHLRNVIYLATICVVLVQPPTAHAEHKPSVKDFLEQAGIELGGMGRSNDSIEIQTDRDRTIHDFLATAFETKIWSRSILEYFVHNEKERRGSNFLHGVPENYRSLIQAGAGAPQFGVIHKWADKKIPVRIGWWGWNAFKAKDAQTSAQQHEKLTQLLGDSIAEFNKNGLISYGLEDESQESKGDPVLLRIVPFHGFKNSKVKRHMHSYADGPWGSEDMIKVATEFTPDHENQVDGYFITDNKNDIRLAVCYINIEDQFPKTYIDECLFRAAGFPNLVPKMGEVLPRAHSILTEREMWNKTQITEDDFYFLKLLYRDDIKSGDGPYKVIETLARHFKKDIKDQEADK